MAGPLAEDLGKPLDAKDGDLRLTLNYIHPASAAESDFLFGRPFNGRSQKKRRKQTVIDVGKSTNHSLCTSCTVLLCLRCFTYSISSNLSLLSLTSSCLLM